MKFDKRYVGLLVVWTALGTLSGTAWAQHARWVSYGPAGGYIIALAVDPQKPDIIYVGSGSGAFKSIDGGERWHAPHPDSAPDAAGVDPLVIDPSNSNTIYGASHNSGSLLKSSDGGLNWTTMSIQPPGSSHEIHWGWWTVALDPRNSSIVYAGHVNRDTELTSAGLFKSRDGGATWQKTNLNSPQIFSLLIDPQDPNVLYVGGAGEVHQSSDGGESWKANAVSIGEVNALVIDPRVPTTLYAGTSSGVLKSSDRGASWVVALEMRTPGPGVSTLLVDPQNPSTVYAGTWQGFYKSTDGGTSWRILGPGLTATILRLALDPRTPNILYAATNRGFFKSTDGGATWRSSNTGLTAMELSGLAVHEQASVFAFNFDRLFKSTDGAQTWNEVSSRLLRMIFLAVHPGNSGTLYAGALASRSFELLKSEDGGVNWTSIQAGLPSSSSVTGLTIDPQNPNTLYARTEVSGSPDGTPTLFKSTDGGAGWVSVGGDSLPTITIGVLAIAPQNPNILYAQLQPYKIGPALFKSSDGGNTWNRIASPRSAWHVAVDPKNSNVVYAGGQELSKSSDGGMSWNPINEGILNDPPYLYKSVTALVIDHQNPAIVYAGTSQGLYRSTNAGASWSLVGSGMPHRMFVSGLAIDSQNSGKVYVATSGGGVFSTFASPVLTLDRALYCVGDSWRVKVTNAAPGSTVHLSGNSNGQNWDVLNWHLADINGDYEEGGTMSPDTLGNHTLRVSVDGLNSNMVSFRVSNCQP